jgi:hypothetical protein
VTTGSRRVATCSAAALLFAVVAFQRPQPPASLILGTWNGTSTCVDKKTDTSCRDEQVIYEVDSAGSPRGPVRMRADKVVNGVREDMGVLTLAYDSAADQWFVDMSTRTHVRWSFAAKGDVMTGTLKELPSNRLIRQVKTRRAPKPAR